MLNITTNHAITYTNRLPLGQISELLRPREEIYYNVKLKWPDTRQHTVPLRRLWYKAKRKMKENNACETVLHTFFSVLTCFSGEKPQHQIYGDAFMRTGA